MKKLLKIMYSNTSKQQCFTSVNQMIETLFVAAFYKISWIVDAVENCMNRFLHPRDSRNGRERHLSRDEKVDQARVF